jgi:hypothetical protein
MITLRSAASSGLLLAIFAGSACSDGGGSSDSPERQLDAGPSLSTPADSGGSAPAPATDPITGFINGLLGDGGLSGITSLFGDGGLSGITNRFADAGFPNFLDGGFDPATLCAQAPQFCPDAGSTKADAGVDAGDASAPDAGDASAPDAAISDDAGGADAASGSDASRADGGGNDAGG